MRGILLLCFLTLLFCTCKPEAAQRSEAGTVPAVSEPSAELSVKPKDSHPFMWEAATVYFLLTDRFNNGKKENDLNFNRSNETGPLRGFMGGDIAGITEKIHSGYFTELGVGAIWFTPVVEQIHGDTDEGTGNSYGYHGYWAKDWTALDPNFGTFEELKTMVEAAHDKGIRIVMDVVLNHTGPVTASDPAWPEDWVRQDPTCDFSSYENTTSCTLVDNLPDIYTDRDTPVELPDALLAKWKSEGRLSTELDELQNFFQRTGYPRAPRFYIIKWLTDYVNTLGIDGFRVDTVKHADEKAWAELYEQAAYAFENWKRMYPERVLDDLPFYMVGEVYNYGASNGREFDFGDRKVDYFDYGFQALINFELKTDAQEDYELVFKKYSSLLHTKLKDKSILNYLTSHDDGAPFDPERKMAYRSANMLLLTPGAAQIYYGDETSRNLQIPGTVGDATLRSFMNWEELESQDSIQAVLTHWQKLGQFRRAHPAIGAGKHNRLSKKPYVFSRSFSSDSLRDKIVIGLDLPKGTKSLSVKGFFGDGTTLYDAYSNTQAVVNKGRVVLDTPYDTALLEAVMNE
ncbi:alpha-amylase family glycosyl hydrolase [Robiginitalea sp.]|uniref:alpha-amylase family glycosyl hydrolase n=1 Tax=Robiginitalea sp. TaxID=1902411 RepID=UPI003C770F5B